MGKERKARKEKEERRGTAWKGEHRMKGSLVHDVHSVFPIFARCLEHYRSGGTYRGPFGYNQLLMH